MSAHQTPADRLSADAVIYDHGPSKVVRPEKSTGVLSVWGAGNYLYTLGTPEFVGNRIAISKRDAGGFVTLQTETVGFGDGTNNYSLTAAGDNLSFIAVYVDEVLAWRLTHNDGAIVS